MKRILFLAAMAATLAACRKNSSAPGEIFLAKVKINGVTETEFIYNAEKQLTEERYYKNESGVAVYSSRSEHIYDSAGRLKRVDSYKMPGNTSTTVQVYQRNAEGLVTRVSYFILNGADLGTLSTHIDYKYNAQKQVTQQSWKNEMEEATALRKLIYHSNGMIKVAEEYNVVNNIAEKTYAAHYSAGDVVIPASMKRGSPFLVNFLYARLAASGVTTYGYDDGAVIYESKETISGEKRNAHGLPLEQTITTKKITPPGADEERVIQYEYVEL